MISRRHFLGASSAAVLAAGLSTTGRVWGANDKVRVATIGVRGRGWDHVRECEVYRNADMSAICDVDAKVLEERVAEFKAKTGRTLKAYQDIRDLLADDDIDAVTIGAPNHWHTLAAIWAMQAGKDVYVEKPISNTYWEGKQLVAAAKKYKKVVQHGTQRRSELVWQRIVERLKAGTIGDVYMARCICFKQRGSLGPFVEEKAPEHLQWDLWQGPATRRAFSPNYVHYNWHWYWHYGNGELGNNVPHLTDVANWVFDKGLPVKVSSSGGRFGYQDGGETPNTQQASYTYADGTMIVCDVRGRYSNDEKGGSVEPMFYGSEGYMANQKFYDKKHQEIPDEKPVREVASTRLHIRAFIDAVRAQDPAAVPATPEQGHVAASICHFGNIAYRTGRTLEFDPVTEQFKNDPEASALLTRPYQEGFEVPQFA